jgi:hypothetical protein
MTVKAKGIVKNEFWVLTDGNKRVGEITANGAGRGYTVSFHGNKEVVPTINKLKKDLNFEWVDVPKRIMTKRDQVHDYPTDAEPFGGVWDLQHGAPIYTKEKNSKSWFAAGWYLVKKSRNWKQVFCPKLITIERYEYRGPYKTAEELLKVKA